MATSYPEVTNPDFQLDFPKIKDDLIKNPLNIVREDLDITDDVLKCLKSIKVFMELESTGYQSIMNIKEESEKYKHLLSDL